MGGACRRVCASVCVCVWAQQETAFGAEMSRSHVHTHKKKNTGGALNPGVQRSQVCSVIIVNLSAHILIIIGIFRSTSTKTLSIRCPLTRLRRLAWREAACCSNLAEKGVHCLSKTQTQGAEVFILLDVS